MAAKITENKLDNTSGTSEKKYNIVIHKLGYVTCFCGYVTSGIHTCKVEEGKLSFDYCYESLCPRCDEDFYMTYRDRDSYYPCTQREVKLPAGKEYCEDCFCKTCIMLKKDCFCCDRCGNYDGTQCICYDSDVESNNKSETESENGKSAAVSDGNESDKLSASTV